MTGPLIIEIGRGRLIINESRDGCVVTCEMDGAGVTLFPSLRDSNRVAARLLAIGKRKALDK